MTYVSSAAPAGPKTPSALAHESLLERLVPRYDATRVERRVMDAPPEIVYSEVLHVDFLDAMREFRSVRWMFSLRAWAEHVASLVRWKRREPRPTMSALRLIDLPREGEWVALGEAPPREIVFGAIGRFWSGETRWTPIDASRFAAFDMPGFARIGCNFVVQPVGEGRVQVTYEAHSTTSPGARRAFRRYWFVVSPFVGVIMRATLSVICVPQRPASVAGP
ncbi:MAG: hypothetical protein U0163_04990 [Gemmatimonadaceae bacterium]